MNDPRRIGERVGDMISALATISADEGALTRLYLTPEHKRAANLVSEWMRQAGLTVRMDAAGTMHGLLAAGREGPDAAKRLLIGSHIDTVVDAGKYDGNLGVVVGIVALEEIRARGIAPPFAVEVLAFGDEEGVRYPKTLISSSAIAGIVEPDILELTDKEGMTLRQALAEFSCDPERLYDEGYDPTETLGYLEVHIEQGPVLDQANEALGVVTAIASQGRYRIRVRGEAGHAGTVPMAIRHDALTGAAEIILAVEAIGRAGAQSSLVATVGAVRVSPGAGNVIPAAVECSLDVRAATDDARVAAVAEIRERVRQIGLARGLVIDVETMLEKAVSVCAPRLRRAIAAAIHEVEGRTPRELMSGAGHDGQAMVRLTDIGMIFVRCGAGISHSPLESVTVEDMGLAVEALVQTITVLAKESA